MQAVQLFASYGSVCYSDQMMPTDYNFTGQRLDSLSGLLYDHARYYDPVSGRFSKADTVQGNAQGMNPYTYVGGNPETNTDPTGKNCYDPTTQTVKVGCGNPSQSQPGTSTPTWPTSGVGNGSGSGDGTTTVTPARPSQGNPKIVHAPAIATGCDLKCHAAKAAAALHAQDAKATAFNSLVVDGGGILADILSVIADWGNTAALVLDIVGSFLPHLLHMIADIVVYNGGTIPPLLQGLMAVGDALAGVANVIKTFALFAFSVSGVIRNLVSIADQSVKEIIASAVSSIGSATTSFIGMKQDVINLQDYNIDNVWTPQQIIDHCQAAGLSSCG